MPVEDTWIDDNFKIRQGSREPAFYRVGKGGGAATLTIKIPEDKLQELMTTGIESAAASTGGQRIKRVLPIAHPVHAHMFLRDLDNVQGISFEEKVESDPYSSLEVPALPFYAKYALYEAQARFEPRPYALIPDDSIPFETVNYYDTAGVSQSETVASEWWRYTYWLGEPAAEYLTADQGMYTFAIPTPVTGGPDDNKSAGKGMIRKLISEVTWKLQWHMVPYSYFLSTNTYLTRYQGHVNQQLWEGFQPGTLLLQAVTVNEVYSPPFPKFVNYAGVNAVSQEKLCDLTLTFLEVLRTTTSTVTPTNASHIPAGHNLAYFGVDMKAYYIESGRTGGPGTGRPVYDSAPFQLIFKNPDAA